MKWWQGAAVIGGTLAASPGIYWWEDLKTAKALAARGLPRADAPGQFPISEPTSGLSDETVVGRIAKDNTGRTRATGPCCNNPDWIGAASVSNEDRVPCHTCGRSIMVVSEHAIH
jgi:hypothetical protein